MPHGVRRLAALVLIVWGLGLVRASAQPVPQPFPRPTDRPGAPTGPAPEPAPPAPVQEALPAETEDPTEASLGLPLYPGSVFLSSYDAGRGQRYYLFGTNIPFEDIVAYYRNVLRDRGNLVFEAPATHMFEVGRFREETMAFPPGVTVKDYTWNGSEGYLNPTPGSDPARFRTVIQVVPSPGPTP